MATPLMLLENFTMGVRKGACVSLRVMSDALSAALYHILGKS